MLKAGLVIPFILCGLLHNANIRGMNLKNHLKEKIAKNQFEAVFQLLKEQTETSKEVLNDVISLEGQYNEAERDLLLGNVTQKDTDVIINRIRNALLHLIDELPSTELISPITDDDIQSLKENCKSTIKSLDLITTALILENDPVTKKKLELQ